jgi:hypothetical protein
MRELRTRVAVEELQAARIKPLQVLIECVHEHPERQVPLQLRPAARKHEVTAVLGALSKLGKQARLADTGLPHQLDRDRPPLSERGKSVIEPTKLLGAPDELLGKQNHLPAPTIEQGARIEKSGSR